MSKAFTREDDAPGPDPLDSAPASPVPPGMKNYLTAAGARRLRDELERLQGAAPGALDPQRRKEREQRMRRLSRSLSTAEVLDPPPAGERVVFGVTVTVQDEHERTRRYRIVGVDEADARVGALSWLSPIAQALLGAKVGDVVTVRTPRGGEDLELLAVSVE